MLNDSPGPKVPFFLESFFGRLAWNDRLSAIVVLVAMSKLTFGLVLIASGCRATAATPGPTSEVSGCSAPPPSYRADVQPVLRERCFACHAGSGDEVEDHDFSTFEKVYAQRADIEGKVRARAMPPAGRPQLTETERRTLLAWIGCRAPEN